MTDPVSHLTFESGSKYGKLLKLMLAVLTSPANISKQVLSKGRRIQGKVKANCTMPEMNQT